MIGSPEGTKVSRIRIGLDQAGLEMYTRSKLLVYQLTSIQMVSLSDGHVRVPNATFLLIGHQGLRKEIDTLRRAYNERYPK